MAEVKKEKITTKLSTVEYLAMNNHVNSLSIAFSLTLQDINYAQENNFDKIFINYDKPSKEIATVDELKQRLKEIYLLIGGLYNWPEGRFNKSFYINALKKFNINVEDFNNDVSNDKDKVLPTNTPESIVDWHKQVAFYYDCQNLNQLPLNANTTVIREAYEDDRSNLETIAQEMQNLTQYNRWPIES